jgi:CBS domain containing-hemolysin-like protein
LRVKTLVKQGVANAEKLDKLLQHPGRFLATILFLNNLVNIGAASLATLLVGFYIKHWVAAISTGVMTFIILIYGEITPKTYAAQNAEKLALRLAGVTNFLSTIFSPIVRFLVFIANFFIRLLGGTTIKEVPFLTEEELKSMVSVAEEEAVIEEEERKLIHSIFEFGDTVVKEVMVPRMDMVTIDAKAPIEEVLSLIVKEGHSRIPVYEGTIDNIIGIVYAKDLLIQMSHGKIDVPLKELVRSVYFIPESKKVNELLRELQKRRQHMAIVVDEYGGTAGLVTIEDLLEEIVGEIFDEYDIEETMVERIDENTIRVDSRVNIDEINELLGVNLAHNDIETIGGFVYSLVGKIPSPGEVVEFENLVFTVEKVIGRRISKILITKKEAVGETSAT